MRLLDLTLATLSENLALDEALLLEAEEGRGGEVLRLWEWPTPAVVLGSGGIVADDVDDGACQRDAVPLGRRSSGGGTVLLGRGCLLFSLVLAYTRSPRLTDIHASYRFILDHVTRALAPVAPVIEQQGISDLTWAGRKFSGNAQQRKRDHLLHHGTLLYSFDLSLVERYLKPPPRQPAYRAGRPHLDFVGNLVCEGTDLRRRLAQAWQAEPRGVGWPQERVLWLVGEKYSRPEWVRRR